MRLSKSFFYTIREQTSDEDSVSGNLLVRAGMMKKVASGIYMMMPLGLKALNKVIEIIREEMNAIGSQELSMPALIPEDVYIASGRRETFGDSMFSLKDRYRRAYVLGPTHEELFAAAAKMHIRSYKDLPFSLYQFQTKYRDEP
ncbi:MAG: proline--tRNA ligase, partial [Clostridiaceae bacterium]|nr:proline--tRNA ligase [Clostridiaceae bacterium]